MTARVLSEGDQNLTGYQLAFNYDGSIDPPPSILDCPQGLQRTKVWTLANGSPDRFVITTLAGWERKARKWETFSAEAKTYLGSSSYQLIVSSQMLNPGEVGTVGLCATAFGAKEKDGSMYLEYHLISPTTKKSGFTHEIGWSGTGVVGVEKGPITVDQQNTTIIIKGQSYHGSHMGLISGVSGMPYLQWTGSTITGNNNSYKYNSI